MHRPTQHALAAALLLLGTVTAQMEKRWIDRYAETAFAGTAPAVGVRAPNLQLTDLDGTPRSLHAERGRKVVLIAGSFT